MKKSAGKIKGKIIVIAPQIVQSGSKECLRYICYGFPSAGEQETRALIPKAPERALYMSVNIHARNKAAGSEYATFTVYQYSP